jgi:UDP-perosamine 4-acetyltransferase
VSKNKQKQIILIGGGDFTKKVIRLISGQKQYHILGYTDIIDRGELFGVKYLGEDKSLIQFLNTIEDVYAVMCIAGNIKLLPRKLELIQFYKSHGCIFPSVISVNAFVDQTVLIGEGVLVFDKAYIDFNVILGNNVVINIDSLLGHDSSIGNNSTISPKSIIGGGTKIGSNCFIGLNSTINPYLKIHKNIIIGAGSLVHKSLNEPGIYAGNPCKKIR